MTIFVTSPRYGAVSLLDELIRAVVPAHIAVTSNQEVSNYIVSNQYIGAGITSISISDIAI